MCGMCLTSDELEQISEARQMLDELLRLPLQKALSLQTPKDFDRAVIRIALQLRRWVNRPAQEAIREAARTLEVDWQNTTTAQRRQLIREAMIKAGRAMEMIPSRIQAGLGPEAERIILATRSHSRRAHGLAIRAQMNAFDHRISNHITRTQARFIHRELKARAQNFGERAAQIVSESLESGLGRGEIASSLHKEATRSLLGGSPFYWEIVAGAFVGQGRSFAQLSSYAEAGIARYVIEAVLDERTTEICRYLHGKVFEVGDGLKKMEAMSRLEDLDGLKEAHPWVRETAGAQGERVLYVDRGGGRSPIVEVTRSGFGRVDDRGEHRRGLSERALMDLGISFPPYHGLCRTSTLPID